MAPQVFLLFTFINVISVYFFQEAIKKKEIDLWEVDRHVLGTPDEKGWNKSEKAS